MAQGYFSGAYSKLTDGRSFPGIKYLFIFSPAIIYFFIVSKYALNLPSQDDYDAILGFLIKYDTAHGWEKLFLLFSQHNEHRILSSRLLYILYDRIFGSINFRSIIFIGNAQLLLLFIITIGFIKKSLPHYWVIASFITGLCLFDPNGWENADFAMGSMQNYGVILLFAASLYFYSLDNKKWLAPAAVFQVVCIYSSGNGIIAAGFLILATILLKDRVKVIMSITLFSIFSPLYFLDYRFPAPHQSIGFSNTVIYFFHLVSSHIYYDYVFPSIITGIVLAVVFLLVLPVKKRLQVNAASIPLVCMAGFIWASMGTITLFRSNLAAPSYCSRYLIYPHFLFAITFVFLLIKLAEKKFTIPLIVVATLLLLHSYRIDVDGGLTGFTFLNKTLNSVDFYYPDSTGAKVIADKACELNIYCIEQHRLK
jgi:hypothetical protein